MPRGDVDRLLSADIQSVSGELSIWRSEATIRLGVASLPGCQKIKIIVADRRFSLYTRGPRGSTGDCPPRRCSGAAISGLHFNTDFSPSITPALGRYASLWLLLCPPESTGQIEILAAAARLPDPT